MRLFQHMQLDLNAKQDDALTILEDNTTNELIFGGGAGGGKSFFGCLWVIIGCRQYPGSRWVIGRSKLKALKETTLATFFEVCGVFGLMPNEHFNYNAQDSTITFSNKSKVILKDLFSYPSDPNFDSLGSLEITGAFVDECNQISWKAWEVLGSRIRFKLDEFGLIPKLLGTCNPSKNWVYSEYYKPSIQGTLKDNRKFIQALVTDNPFISPHYIRNLKNIKNKATKERLLKGNWNYDDDPSALISYDDIVDIFTNQGKKGDTYITVDVARKGKDNTVVIFWKGLQGEVYTLKREIKKDLTKTKDWILNLANARHVGRSRIIIDEDGVGGGLVDMIDGCKGFVNNATPIEDNGVKPNYRNLKSQCSFKLADMIKKIGIKCDQDVKDLIIEELEQIKQKNIDKDGKNEIIGKDEVKENIGRSPDYSDAIMMRMLPEIDNEEPQIFIY